MSAAKKPPASTPLQQASPQIAANQWKPGQSGNPAGRKKGSRNKLSDAFVDALFANFTEAVAEGGKTKGEEVIEHLRTEDPAAYVKALVALAPKHVHVKEDVLDAFDDDELTAAMAAVVALRQARGAGEEDRGEADAPAGQKPH